jgi:hypothetical protein
MELVQPQDRPLPLRFAMHRVQQQRQERRLDREPPRLARFRRLDAAASHAKRRLRNAQHTMHEIDVSRVPAKRSELAVARERVDR